MGERSSLPFFHVRGCRVIQPDLRRAGGPSELRTVASLAAGFGVPSVLPAAGRLTRRPPLTANRHLARAGISEGGSGFPVIEDGCALAPRGPGFEWQ